MITIKPTHFSHWLLIIGTALLLALTTLACGLGQGNPAGDPVIGRLPTLTPTANAPDRAGSPTENQPSPAPLSADNKSQPVDNSTPQVQISRLPTLTPTPSTADASGQPAPPANTLATIEPPANALTSELPQWEFSNVTVNLKPDEGTAQLLGQITNTSNFAQKLSFITGTFYDAQGNPVAGEDFTVDYWPTNIVPPGEKLPFELIVLGVQDITNFDLRAEAQVVDNKMLQGFEFAALNSWQEEELFCLDGQIINSAGQIQQYLTIIAVVFDDQDHVTGFADYYVEADQANTQPLSFDMCTELSQPNMARHELRAWGE